MTTNSAVPSGSPAPAQAEGRPTTVNASFWLYILAAVVSIVTIIIALVAIPAQAAKVTNANTNAHISTGAVTGLATGSVVVGGIIGIAIFVIFGILMRGGRNWARIILIIVGGLSVLSVLPNLGADYGVAAARAVIILIALILSVLPASNAWFRQMKASRMSGQMMPPPAPPQA